MGIFAIIFLSFLLLLCFFFSISLITTFLVGFFLGMSLFHQKSYKSLYDIEMRGLSCNVAGFIEKMFIKQKLTAKITSQKFVYYLYQNKTNKAKKRKVLVFHHGIKCTKLSSYKHFIFYHNLGFDILIFDSRSWGENKHIGVVSYGLNEKHDLFSILKDVIHHVDIDYFVLHGESMGAATVLQFLNCYEKFFPIRAAILDSGYYNLRQVFDENFKNNTIMKILFPMQSVFFMALDINFLFRLHTRCDKIYPKKMYHIQTPRLIIHSVHDSTVPFSQAKIIKTKSIGYVKIRQYLMIPHCMGVVFKYNDFCNNIKKFLDDVNY